MDLVYFERQVDKMCAQHALNMLLQGDYFSPESLMIIAEELDNRERAVLSPQEEAQFQSQNYDVTGYFSIQVIIEALRRQANLYLESVDSPDPTIAKIRDNPSLAKAFIINMKDHWFTIRKINTTWFILNSLNEAPRTITQFHMEEYIHELYKRRHSVYVIQGDLPACPAENLPRDYWSNIARAKKFDTDLEKAIAISLMEAQTYIASKSDEAAAEGSYAQDDLYAGIPAPAGASFQAQAPEDFEIQRALEESLKDVKKNFDVDTVDALQLNEAIQNSLYEAIRTGAEPSSSTHRKPPSPGASVADEGDAEEKPPPAATD